LFWFAKIFVAVSVLGAGLGMVNAIKGVSFGGGGSVAGGVVGVVGAVVGVVFVVFVVFCNVAISF
jgi:hypothetical protein